MSIVINEMMGKHLYWVVIFCQNSWPFQQLLLVLNVCLVCTLHYLWAQVSWKHSKPIHKFFFSKLRDVWNLQLFHPLNHISLNYPNGLPWLLQAHGQRKKISIIVLGSVVPVVRSIRPLIFAWAICITIRLILAYLFIY